MAWGVLLMSFAIFCALCIVTGLGVQWFLFQSTVPLVSRMEVGRGTVGITLSSDPREQVARVEYDLSGAVDTTVRTDAQSQAAISFFDTDRLVATVTLRSNTSLDLRDAVRPRFEWSTVAYDVVLVSFSGEIDVSVADHLDRGFRMGIQTEGEHGYWILLTNGGSYVANASSSQVNVINLDGEAILVPPDATEGDAISPGYRAISSDDFPTVVLSSVYTDLVANTVFPGTAEAGESGREPGTDIWTCANGESDSPQGQYWLRELEGRQALQLVRANDATSHGETRCIKWFGQEGESVESYDYLALHAAFFINYHSLTACGVAGSECPLMLRLDYVDTEGIPRRWYHGFYYQIDPQQGYPLRCNSDTCTQDHLQVNEKSWYTFDSGNLFTLFQQHNLPLPGSIINVQFYASGHQYDVYISDVSLLAGQNTQTDTEEAPALAG
jgi:hypothetical protein